MEKLKTYNIILDTEDDTQGITAISVVSDPAIESPAIFLSKSEDKVIYKLSEVPDQQIITGPVLIPDKLILRKDEKTGEYYNIKFSKDIIKELSIKFFQQKHNTNTTLEHEVEVPNTTYFESWIIEDYNTDKAKAIGLEELPTGTWVVSLKVHDTKLWNEIKDKGFSGFSIEAFLNHKIENKKINIDMSKLDMLLKSIKTLFSEETIDQVVEPTKEEVAMKELTLEDGTIIFIDETSFIVSKKNDDGSLTPMEDGTYKLQDGTDFIIKDGKEFKEQLSTEEPSTEEVKVEENMEFLYFTLTDGSMIYIDNSNVPRYYEDDSILADGDYETLDGQKFTVKDSMLLIADDGAEAEFNKDIKSQYKIVKQHFNSIKAELESVKTELSEKLKKIKELNKMVKDLEDAPATSHTATYEDNSKKVHEMSLADRILYNIKKNNIK